MNTEQVVSKEKGDSPVYTRIGVCNECGADVYAPLAAASEDDFKLMSACACEGGPKASAAGRRPETSPAGERNSEAGKKAA
jgi:hypothetical protein